MSKTERQVEQECVAIVRELGGECRKLDVGHGSKGWFDQAMWLPGGKHLLIEFKTETGELSKFQEYRANHFDDIGFTVHVIRSVSGFQWLLSQVGAA